MSKTETTPTIEDTEVASPEMGRSPDYRFEGGILNKNPEAHISEEELADKELTDEERIFKMATETHGVPKEELKSTHVEYGHKFDGKDLIDKNSNNLSELIRNSDLSADKKFAHEDMLNHLRNNPEQPYMLPDWKEETEKEVKTHITFATMDGEGNIRYETLTYTENKEEREEIYPSPETPTITPAVEQQALAEAVAEVEAIKDVTIESEEVVTMETVVVQSVVAEIVPEFLHDDVKENILEHLPKAPNKIGNIKEVKTVVAPKIAEREAPQLALEQQAVVKAVEGVNVEKIETVQKAEKIMTLEDKIRDLLRNEPLDTETPPLANEKNIMVKSKIPDIAQKSSVIKETREEKEISEIQISQTKPVELVDTEIISPYIEQPILERTLETVVASNSIEVQASTAETIVIAPKSEINEKNVEATVASTEIPLVLDEKETIKMVNKNVVSKIIEIGKKPEEEIVQATVEVILNTDKEEDLSKDGHEMLLRILGIPITRKETRNEPNLNESIHTRPIPYSAEESDNNTSAKPIGIKPQAINTLNGITLLKKAA